MLIFVYSALIVVFDQLFKQWIIMTHAVGQETVLIPGFFSLFRLHNPGAAFGFMAGLPWWVLAAIQLAASIALIMIILRYTEGFWGSLGLASVLGGAVGNLIDRIMHQYVVDMFRFMFIDFAIFNLADVFITLGFLMFLIHFIVYTFKSDKNKAALADGPDADDFDRGQPVPAVEPAYDAVAATTVAPVAPVAPVSPVAAVAPVAATPPDQASLDFNALAQVEPAQAEFPVSENLPAAQAVVQPPITQPIAQAQPMSQPTAQPLPQQAAEPIAPPIAPAVPQAPAAQESDLTQQVDPMEVFGTSPSPAASTEPIDPSSQTGPLPTKEIKPLLDHVYGGQYIAKKQEEAAQAAQAVQSIPPNVAAVPQADSTPTAQPPTQIVTAAPPMAQPTTPPTAPAPAAQPPTVRLVPAKSAAAPPPVAQTPTPEASSVPSAPIETPPSADDNPKAMLDALTALESELLGENALDDYNADKLLGEYGFETED